MKELQSINHEFTKSQIKVAANQVVDNLIETGDDVLRIVETIANAEAFIKLVKTNPAYVDYVRSQVGLHQKGIYTSPRGTKIELAETGTSYHFEHCGDSEWELLNQQLESLKVQIADREKLLKALPSCGENITCKLTGEIKLVYPPYKTSNSSYKVTIAK